MNTEAVKDQDVTDLVETRIHILTASRELLFAAKGALSFCAKFVDASGVDAPYVKVFFKKAMTVADDLSAGLENMDSLRHAASNAIKPLFTMMEHEMRAERDIPHDRNDRCNDAAKSRSRRGSIAAKVTRARSTRRRKKSS